MSRRKPTVPPSRRSTLRDHSCSLPLIVLIFEKTLFASGRVTVATFSPTRCGLCASEPTSTGNSSLSPKASLKRSGISFRWNRSGTPRNLNTVFGRRALEPCSFADLVVAWWSFGTDILGSRGHVGPSLYVMVLTLRDCAVGMVVERSKSVGALRRTDVRRFSCQDNVYVVGAYPTNHFQYLRELSPMHLAGRVTV